MTTTPRPELVDEFLRQHHWNLVKAVDGVRKYSAPADLGTAEDFVVSVPQNPLDPGADLLLSRVVRTLANLYDLDPDQLTTALSTPDTVVSVRVSDETTTDGSIALSRFDGIIDRLRKALLDTASFVLTDDPLLDSTPPAAAEDYINNCRFLQTEIGSFVARIQLPAGKTLEMPLPMQGLDNRVNDRITSDAVNDRFADIVAFVTRRVLPTNDDELFSQEAMAEKADILNVNVLADLRDLFERAGSSRLSIAFLNSGGRRDFEAGDLNAERLERLGSFVSFARAQVVQEFPVDVTGKIIQLTSRNVRGRRRQVIVQVIHDNRPTEIAVRLTRGDYTYAGEAHVSGRRVRVIGTAKKLRTRLSITDLESFQVLDDNEPPRA